jgi:UDPglucose 6-dehydrogenase
VRLAVIGTGHVGLVACVTLAEIGHDVTGMDCDPDKIAKLSEGSAPFYEPGMEELLVKHIAAHSLRFTLSEEEALAQADVVFICVGTPPLASGEASLLAVEKAALMVARQGKDGVVIVEKSTVPAGTAERVQLTLTRARAGLRFTVVSNPEFLREGSAVTDSLRPDRILVGAESHRGFQVMRRLYRPLLRDGCRLIETDIATAELAKHACNAFLSLKISFANAVSEICELAGADVVSVADVMGSDHRIGRSFLDAGLGFGGFCFPKDLAAFERLAAGLGYDFPLLHEVTRINERAVDSVMAKVRDALWNLEEKRIALLGLAFKSGTDDTRLSPALALARRLLAEGASVVGYDPKAGSAAKTDLPEMEVVDDAYEAAWGAHCLVVCAEWGEFRDLDLAALREMMLYPVVVDGRNVFDPNVMRKLGFTYYPTGRPPIIPTKRRAASLRKAAVSAGSPSINPRVHPDGWAAEGSPLTAKSGRLRRTLDA